MTNFLCFQILAALSSLVKCTSSHAGQSTFAKESIPSQSLSILNDVLNSPERRVNGESSLKRLPDGQQHAKVEPDHILLHLQSMTGGSGWNIFSNHNKDMTKGRKTVNDEFLLPSNASWWSSPESAG